MMSRPYVALTSHAQLFSVHCAAITDGRYIFVDKKRSVIPKLTYKNRYPQQQQLNFNQRSSGGLVNAASRILFPLRGQLGYDHLRRLLAYKTSLASTQSDAIRCWR